MYEVTFDERHKTGLERLTGGNRGIVFANERKVLAEIPSEDGGDSVQVEKWAYDAYEVEDARSAASAKNSVIGEQHPMGDEQKILRKTLARVLKVLGDYDGEDNAEFKAYNEFVEALEVKPITGSVNAEEPTEEELLKAAKAKKIDEIAEFDASANVNAFTVNGIPMWLNFDQRSRLRASIEACNEETMTKYFGGVAFTYPVALWQQMLSAVELYADTCQTVTEAHKAEVMSKRKVSTVEAFDVTVGYPSKLSF